MGIEIPQDESIILRGEEIVEGGGEIGGAGGDWRDVDVEDIEWSVIDDGSDCEVFCGCVVGEEGVGVDRGEMDGVMNENDKTTPARGAGAVTTNCEEIVKWLELRVRGEFTLLDAGYEYGLGMKEGVEFGVGVGDPIDIYLEDGVGVMRLLGWGVGRARGSRGSVKAV